MMTVAFSATHAGRQFGGGIGVREAAADRAAVADGGGATWAIASVNSGACAAITRTSADRRARQRARGENAAH